LLTYGGLPGEKKIHRLARRLGVPVVFFLSNCLYRKPDTFADVDLILVPSKFLREFYRERLGIGSRVLYPVISKARCLFNPACQSSNLEKEKFVTLVNPHPQKGLAVFIRLAAECMQLFPNLKFLLVEGRWNLKELANQPLLSGLPNVRLMENSLDMRQVYASTKILLFPSFWLDAFGQTVVEAHLNGIPVLASDRGGIPEALNGAGFLLDVPDGIPKELKSAKAIFEIASQRARGPIPIPTAEEIRPWIATIRLLLESRDAYEEASKRAYIAAEPFHSESTLQMAADLFRGYRPTVSHRA
jgi:glycosyltransferase involved in cell wall biosynthesis